MFRGRDVSVVLRRWDAIGSELVLLVCFMLGYLFFNFDQARLAAGLEL